MAASSHEIRITAVPDTTQLASVARIVAKHLSALADDLDQATKAAGDPSELAKAFALPTST